MIIKTSNKPYDAERAAKEAIAGHANKSETAAWTRKRKSIERLIETKISPLEDKIMELNGQLMPLYDQLAELRTEMVEYCIHPIDMLIAHDGVIVCKFCDAKMAVPKVKANDTSEA
jgi:hypothetical protein